MFRRFPIIRFVVPILLFCLAALTFAQDTKQEDAKKPDRSGEKLLRSVLIAHGKLRNVYATIWQASYNPAFGNMDIGGTTELWYRSPKVWHIEQSGHWGDAVRLVCDGTTLLKDVLVQGERTTLQKAKEDLFSTGDATAPSQSAGSLFYVFLLGEPGFDKLVQKDSAITLVKNDPGLTGISFRALRAGEVTVYVDENDSRLPIKRIDQKLPMDFFSEGPMFMRQFIDFRSSVKFPRNAFSTVLPKGTQVNDLRIAKVPPHRVR